MNSSSIGMGVTQQQIDEDYGGPTVFGEVTGIAGLTLIHIWNEC